MTQSNKQPGFIEVTGKGEYKLSPVDYRMTLEVTFKTGFSKLDVKSSVLSKETEKVLMDIVNRLLENGFPENQISLKGTQDFQRWRHKGYDTLRSSTIVMRSDDYKLMIKVPFWLENINTGKHKINFSALQPVYTDDEEKHKIALGHAFDQAKARADILAGQSGQKLGPALIIQDKKLYQRSGNDYDFYDEPVMAAGGGYGGGDHGASGLEDYDLEEPTRDMSVEIRARFALN